MAGFFQTIRSAITGGGLEIAPYTVIRKEKVFLICYFFTLKSSFRVEFYFVLGLWREALSSPKMGENPN